jgi:hypothetical protein
MSRRVVQFNTTPIVSWQESQEPLISPRPSASQGVGGLQSPPDSQVTPVPQRFPINNLAPRSTQSQRPHNPPTPPPEILDDSDAMDWTPSQFSLQPNHSITRLVRQPSVPEASPFHGRLPAAPNPPAWQLRNAQNRQVPQPPAETPRRNPFSRGPVGSTPNLNSNQEAQLNEPASEMTLAPPKFFPPEDFATDTGLENLFDNAFTIADEPTDVQKTRWQQMTDLGNQPGLTPTLPDTRSRVLKCALLLSSLFAWYFADTRSVNSKHIEIVSLGVACLIAGLSLLEALKKPAALRSVSDIIISLVELVASAYLGGSIPRGPSTGIFFTKAGECLLSFMTTQEIMALIWPRYLSSEPSEKELAAGDASFSRPTTRDTDDGIRSNAPYSEGRTSVYTATPGQNVQHSPSPSPSFSVASSTQSSSVASPFSSRNAAADITTPLRSQRFAPPAAARPIYSPVPSFIGFSLNDNEPQKSAATGAAGPATRRYPTRGRRG